MPGLMGYMAGLFPLLVPPPPDGMKRHKTRTRHHALKRAKAHAAKLARRKNR